MIGIYEIYNGATNKSYIGSSVNIPERVRKHFRLLKNGKHTNRHLQSAYNKDGESVFGVRILQETTKEDLRATEQFWIDFFNAYNDTVGYNILPKAGTSLGFKHTAETKEKMRVTNSRVISEETRRKLSAAGKGKKNRLGTKASDETKALMSKQRLGNQYARKH